MKPSTSLWLLPALFFMAGIAYAQTACPPGMIPYGTGVCGYDPSQQQQPAQLQPQPPSQQWQDHWGAIATDIANRSIGTSTNKLSQKSAEEMAIADCQSKGGTNCEIEIAYRNECSALAAGDTGHNAKAGFTVAAAMQSAMKVCSASDKNCEVYYTACSLPVRIQ